MRIVISSGHGKYIRGASGYLDEVNEARRVVECVAEFLRAANVDVKTFHDDVSNDQSENLERIVDFHNAQTRDLDVSVHFNAYQTTPNPMGTETLFVTQHDLAETMSRAISNAAGFINRGPKKRTDLYFLNNTDEPAILIETCFVDSLADAQTYEAEFENICQAIASTISGETVVAPPEPDVPPQPEPPPSFGRPTIGRGDSGPEVVSVQKTLGLPADGDFGPVTEAGVKGFQGAVGLGEDGIVGPNTWSALDELKRRLAAGNDGISDQLAEAIDRTVADYSPVQAINWPDRGKPPSGYYAGMSKTFALALTRLKTGDEAAQIMAAAESGNPDKDALTWYADEFAKHGMTNDVDGVETLRHLFVLMFGLGMRESSGNSWEGRDMSADNVQADTCEAGLFQTSWNISSCSSEIDALMAEFHADPNGF